MIFDASCVRGLCSWADPAEEAEAPPDEVNAEVAPDLDAAAADVAEAERLLRIKEAAEAKGDAPAEGLVEEDAFVFVVFDGGDKSIAEVKLKKEATWADMKAALLGKMGDGARVYGVRYVDPSQGGKTCLARNEEEWQACWAVASAEKDRELEVERELGLGRH